MGGQGGCERRIEVFVKIQKKNFFEGGGVGSGGEGLGLGVRVDVNEELKLLRKFTKNRGGGGKGVARSGGGSDSWGVWVDVSAMLGVGDDLGYWGCEPRIGGIVKKKKKVDRAGIRTHDLRVRKTCSLIY